MSKTALVLSGGGAKGAFQIGVMEKLFARGFKPDAIYGTSVGAINAAGYHRLGFERLKEEWLKIEGRSDIMGFNWHNLLTGYLFASGVWNMNPLRKKFERFVQEPLMHPDVEAIVTKVSLQTGALSYVRSGEPDFLNSLVASASIPIINNPVDNEWVDGGVREQIPLSQAIKDGYTNIVCIVNNPWHVDPEEWKFSRFLALAKILIRIADSIQSCETFVNDIKTVLMLNGHPAYANINLTLYMPDRLLIGTQQFDPKLIREVMQQGRDTEPFDLKRIV